jgi:thymidylate synthase (FAD)
MKIELLNYFGNDEMVVNVARVSYGKDSSNYEADQNYKLINYLANHGHTSPFRHPQLQFRLKVPIYVERQLRKHEIGIEVQPIENVSINSISGRYVDFSDSYTRIKQWRKQSKTSKQGSEGLVDDQETCQLLEQTVLTVCKQAYDQLLSLGVSKEQARTILPLNLDTEYIWTGSLMAFIHLSNLRLKPDAQQETRCVVNTMLYQVENIRDANGENPFEYCLEAFDLKSDLNYILI